MTERFLAGRCWRTLTLLADLLELSLCWSLCSLPVVTMGAATAALLELLPDLEAGGGVVKRYRQGLRRCWRRATLFWLAGLGGAAVVLVDLAVCIQNFSQGLGWALLTGFMAGAALVLAAALVYLLALAAKTELPLRQAAGRAVLLTLGCLPSTLALWLSGAVGLWLAGRLWWIAFLFPAFFFLPTAGIVDRVLRRWGQASLKGGRG